MSERLWGIGLVSIGALWVGDGWRLWKSERAASMFDALGPDRYLMLMGGLLLLTGIIIGLSQPEPAVASTEEVERGNRRHVAPLTFLLVLGAYALIMPWLGYAISTLLFFVAAYFLAGRRNLVATLITSVISAVCFYVIFPYLADMPLPRGIFAF